MTFQGQIEIDAADAKLLFYSPIIFLLFKLPRCPTVTLVEAMRQQKEARQNVYDDCRNKGTS